MRGSGAARFTRAGIDKIWSLVVAAGETLVRGLRLQAGEEPYPAHVTLPAPQPLSIPDRFEGLQRRAETAELRSIVLPVEHSLGRIDSIYKDMLGAERGAFLVLRGSSGAGKST